ncbi:MAG: STAS-like domain-containing protein [Sphingobacteriia bacterium]|jgi:hypothetical protein
MTISILTLAPGTFDYSDGFAVFKEVEPYLVSAQEVRVDYHGTGGLSTSFLNGFLGEAFDRFGVEKVKSHVKMARLSTAQADMLRRYAAQYLELKNRA